jgi:hypothetical protein
LSVIEIFRQLRRLGVVVYRWVSLLCVMQLFPQGFYYQTDEAKGDGICDQNLIKANRVMHARYRNGACYADKSPNIAHALAGRWKGRCGKDCPKARE